MDAYLAVDHNDPDRLDRYTRGVILLLLGGVLLPNTSGNMVHGKVSQLIIGFDVCRTYAWGAAALVCLYRGLAHAARIGRGYDVEVDIEGCTFLLYGWLWLRYPSLAPIVKSPVYTSPAYRHFPLLAR